MKQPKGEKKKIQWRKILGYILMITLWGSLAYAIVSFFVTPADVPLKPHGRLKADYALMILQCAVALVVMSLPTFVEKKWKIRVPNFMYVLYFIFLYCAVYLGEVRNFYFAIPNWDTILHTFSGGMLGALGFILVDLLNDSKRISIQLSPFFVAFFAFCFALACGVIWELYEFTMDSLFQLNMQKYMTETGTLLVGREALIDTMQDLIVDTVGSLVVSVVGYVSLRRGHMWKEPERMEEDEQESSKKPKKSQPDPNDA